MSDEVLVAQYSTQKKLLLFLFVLVVLHIVGIVNLSTTPHDDTIYRSTIQVDKGDDDESATFLSVSEFPGNNKVFLADKEDGSGRQIWSFKLVYGSSDLYNIYTESGRTPKRSVLCADLNRELELVETDDKSGKMQWSLFPVEGKPHYYTMEVLKGRAGSQKNTLSAIQNSFKVDFYYSDDGSGRQQWYIPNLKHSKVVPSVKAYDNQYKDQSIRYLDQALSLPIDFSKVKIAFEGSKLGDDSIFNALPFKFWVSGEEGKSESWGSALLSLKTHFGYYVDPNSPSEVSQTKASVTLDKFIPEKFEDDSTKVAFKTSQGLYLSCNPDGTLSADRYSPNAWETFQIYKSNYCPNKNLGSSCIAIKSAYTDMFRKSETWIRAARDGTLKCDMEKFEYVSQLFYGWNRNEPKKKEEINFSFASAKWQQNLLAESFFELPEGKEEVPMKLQYDISNQNKIDWQRIDKGYKKGQTFASDDGKIVITDPGYQGDKRVLVEDKCVSKSDAKVKCITKLMNSTLEVDYIAQIVHENGYKQEIQSTWKGQILHTVLEMQ